MLSDVQNLYIYITINNIMIELEDLFSNFVLVCHHTSSIYLKLLTIYIYIQNSEQTIYFFSTVNCDQ